MAAGIAHEIRNPLASMSGSIQILRQELPLSDEQAQLMDIVLRESERLNETIRSFLAYARPQRFPIARARRAPGAATTRRCCCATAPRCRTGTSIDVDVPADAVVVRGRREPDPADRVEPGDQRAAGDARRRPAAPVGARRARRRRERSGGGARSGRRGRRHSRPTSSRRIFQPFHGSVQPAAPAWGWPSCTASSATTAARSA